MNPSAAAAMMPPRAALDKDFELEGADLLMIQLPMNFSSDCRCIEGEKYGYARTRAIAIPTHVVRLVDRVRVTTVITDHRHLHTATRRKSRQSGGHRSRRRVWRRIRDILIRTVDRRVHLDGVQIEEARVNCDRQVMVAAAQAVGEILQQMMLAKHIAQGDLHNTYKQRLHRISY